MPDDDESFQRGLELASSLFAGVSSPPRMPSEMVRHSMGHLFGDVWQGPELDVSERVIITCAVMVALAREHEQRLLFRAARNIGIYRQKLDAIIIHVAHYAGFPVAISAFAVLAETWDEMDAADKQSVPEAR